MITLIEPDPDDRTVVYRNDLGMRIVQDGDRASVEFGETIVLRLPDKDVMACLREFGKDPYPCKRCPLNDYTCDDWVACPDNGVLSPIEDEL